MGESDQPKIYVSAVVCSDVIEETGTSMLSALRISGGFVVGPVLRPTADAKLGEWVFDTVKFFVVITINSETATSFQFGMRTSTPDGRIIDLSEQQDFREPITIGRGAEGITLKTRGAIPGSVAGDYWIELYVNGRLANKVPLRIVHPHLGNGLGAQPSAREDGPSDHQKD